MIAYIIVRGVASGTRSKFQISGEKHIKSIFIIILCLQIKLNSGLRNTCNYEKRPNSRL